MKKKSLTELEIEKPLAYNHLVVGTTSDHSQQKVGTCTCN